MVKPKKSYNKKPQWKPKPRKYLPVGVPQTQIVKLKFSERVSLNPGVAGLADNIVYRANGMFDPSVTYTGHQPMFYDTFLGNRNTNAPYHEFVVLGSKIKCEFVSTTASESNRVGIYLSNSPTAITDPIQLDELKACSRRILGPPDGGNGVCTLYKNFSAKKWFGHKNVTDEKDMIGNYNTDPLTQAYFHCYAHGLGDDTTTLKVVVTIEYIALLRTVNTPATS